MSDDAVSRANTLREKGDADLMTLYIKLRDRIEVEGKAAKKKLAMMAELLTQIEGVLLERLNERGSTSTSTQDAVAFVENATFCGVADWDALLGYITDNEQFQFLNKAVNKNAVSEYMAEHDGNPPPGVKWTEERQIKIRRK